MSFKHDSVLHLLQCIKDTSLDSNNMQIILDKMCSKVIEDSSDINDLIGLFKDFEKEEGLKQFENISNKKLQNLVKKKDRKSKDIKDIISRDNSTITLTFCECSENHIGMDQNGKKGTKNDSLSYDDLLNIKTNFEEKNYICKLIHLNKFCNEEDLPKEKIFEDAYILVIKNGVECLLDKNGSMEDLFNELTSFDWDTKYWDTRRKKVLNKHARANICISDISEEPDYENKKGRKVSYKDLPLTQIIRKNISEYIGEKGNNLECEGNLYFDKNKCGIGFHGDCERVKVIAARIGSLKLAFQWYYNTKPIGRMCELDLDDSDLYFMSSKSVGNDWKCKSKITLRHAAGCNKYTKLGKNR